MLRLINSSCILVLLGSLLLAACDDDPLIGPTEEEGGGGGSYGKIQRLPSVPPDTLNVPIDSSTSRTPFYSTNPERF